ncbi:MAG: hypothetical protein IJX47_08205 [Clostridia bacterium]|nr:hypothetical protein [Clostridia bacterium]
MNSSNHWDEMLGIGPSDEVLKRTKIKKAVRRWSPVAILVILLALLIVPYIQAEILSRNADQKLADFDPSELQAIYDELIYDIKILSYKERESAKVLYIFGDCEYATLVDLEWNDQQVCWEITHEQLQQTAHGGSADEFYWPFYYGHKFLW